MLKSEKKLAELSKILANGKYNEINDRISILRSEEPFEGALKMLAIGPGLFGLCRCTG